MKALFAYAATTAGVTVRVNPRYQPEHSDPDAGRYVWSYHIRIENGGAAPVQLTARHWVITDSDGHVEEVSGPGVVGETPTIQPGQAFDYVSGCPLPTPLGSMQGHFVMVGGGTVFNAAVPLFALTSPHAGAARN